MILLFYYTSQNIVGVVGLKDHNGKTLNFPVAVDQCMYAFFMWETELLLPGRASCSKARRQTQGKRPHATQRGRPCMIRFRSINILEHSNKTKQDQYRALVGSREPSFPRHNPLTVSELLIMSCLQTSERTHYCMHICMYSIYILDAAQS